MSIEKQNPTDELPQRVFYMWNYLEWGGAQVYLFGFMKKAKKICDVEVLLPRGSDPQLLRYLDNIEIPYEFFDAQTDIQPALTFRRKIERHWNKAVCEFALFKYLKKKNLTYSVIHVDLPPWQSLTLLWWLSRRTKVFVTVHNAMPIVSKWRQSLWKLKFNLLAQMKNFNIFTANKNAKTSLKMYVPKFFFEKIIVTTANINSEEINEVLKLAADESGIRRKYDLPSNKFSVFCVGQFIDRKGRWIFLEAAGRLIEKYKDICFVWITNSKISAEDLKKIESYNLAEDFTLINSDKIGGDHTELFKLLKIADVFTLPSYVEGLPISLLEAMALGIPCISTDVNGIPEAIKDMETGLLIRAGDAVKLAAAIEKLKIDENLRAGISKKGQDFILRNFNEDEVAKIAVAAYKNSFSALHNK